MLSKIAGWKSKVLSQAGRTTLIKAVATSMPIYHMANYLMPKDWCHEIDRRPKNFCWGFKDDKKRHFTPKSWDSVCHPKTAGGLAFGKCMTLIGRNWGGRSMNSQRPCG